MGLLYLERTHASKPPATMEDDENEEKRNTLLLLEPRDHPSVLLYHDVNKIQPIPGLSNGPVKEWIWFSRLDR